MSIAHNLVSLLKGVLLYIFHYYRLQYLVGRKFAVWLRLHNERAWLRVHVDLFPREWLRLSDTFAIATTFVVPATDIQFRPDTWTQYGFDRFDQVLINRETKIVVSTPRGMGKHSSSNTLVSSTNTPMTEFPTFHVIANSPSRPSCVHFTYSTSTEVPKRAHMAAEGHFANLTDSQLQEVLYSYAYCSEHWKKQRDPMNEC